MGDGLGLTWHAGSVLPFASLWHTLHRLVRLNAMRPKEVQEFVARPRELPWAKSVDLLFNDTPALYLPNSTGAIQVQHLAAELSEPVHAFDWSHLGRLPLALRNLATPWFRLCPVCAAGGYHTALFSLKAVDRCPIHRCSLISHCWCGAPFGTVFNMRKVMTAGQCSCGRMAFFTQATCRRPSISAEEVRPISAVAAWLEDMCTVTRPWGLPRSAQQAHDELFVSGLAGWCSLLKLVAPPCEPNTYLPSGVASTSISSRLSTSSPAYKLTSDSEAEPSFSARTQGSMWLHSEATIAYRAMTRHIRRHVGRCTERYAMQFLEHPDPIAMAEQMRVHPQAMVAFAELLFCFTMERFAMNRRWPYRQARYETQRIQEDKLEDPRLRGSCGPEGGLGDLEKTWISRQVAAARITHAWRKAQTCALSAARSGIADWSSAIELNCIFPNPLRDPPEGWNWHNAPPPYQISWAASTKGGRIRFASYPATQRIDWTMSCSSKDSRRETWQAALRSREQHLERLISGPTLKWTRREGWQAGETMRPDVMTATPHHLFLPKGRRARVWLYPSAAGYTLRLAEINLEVSEATPAEAFSSMRTALAMYQTHCGLPPLFAVRKHCVEGRLRHSRDDLESDYQGQLRQISYSQGFWRGAVLFKQVAHRYACQERRLAHPDLAASTLNPHS